MQKTLTARKNPKLRAQLKLVLNLLVLSLIFVGGGAYVIANCSDSMAAYRASLPNHRFMADVMFIGMYVLAGFYFSITLWLAVLAYFEERDGHKG